MRQYTQGEEKPADNSGSAESDSTADYVSEALATAQNFAFSQGDYHQPARRKTARHQPVASAHSVNTGSDNENSSPENSANEMTKPGSTWQAGPGLARGRGRPGRSRFDPQLLGAALAQVSRGHGWDSKLEVIAVLRFWPEVAGPQVAAHAQAIGLEAGVLTVQADSTAWAAQLRLYRQLLLRQLAERTELVREIKILGPSGPSWKRGGWSVPGRGPRDTYG